jgi:7-cyano-7-deazaguanine synthase
MLFMGTSLSVEERVDMVFQNYIRVKKMPESKVLIMLSGGLDSATCLFWAKDRFTDISIMTFNYFRRSEKEKESTYKLAGMANISEVITIEIPFVKEVSDYRWNGETAEKIPSYIPARNLIFYSIALHYSEFCGNKWVIGGHNAYDKKLYRDATREYLDKISVLYQEGSLVHKETAPKIILPLIGLSRSDIIKLAIEVNVPIQITWSCHNDGKVPCGRCHACIQRKSAFTLLKLEDPAVADYH